MYLVVVVNNSKINNKLTGWAGMRADLASIKDATFKVLDEMEYFDATCGGKVWDDISNIPEKNITDHPEIWYILNRKDQIMVSTYPMNDGISFRFEAVDLRT